MTPEPPCPHHAADDPAAPRPSITITFTPDDADAIYRTILGHHVRDLEVHKTRVFAERLRQYVVDQMNAPKPYEVTFNHASQILSAAEVERFLAEGESYRSVARHEVRTA
jgi:hypothetical protein